MPVGYTMPFFRAPSKTFRNDSRRFRMEIIHAGHPHTGVTEPDV